MLFTHEDQECRCVAAKYGFNHTQTIACNEVTYDLLAFVIFLIKNVLFINPQYVVCFI